MKKTAAISVALIVALMLFGVGYALWSETLFIRGTVNTGSLDAEWSVHGVYDSEVLGKDFSAIEAQIVAPGELEIQINNAYPGIEYTAEIDVTNTGSIPLHTEVFELNRGNLPAGATVEITDMNGDPLVGKQVHPGEQALGKVVVHLDNDAAELANYTFGASLQVNQYNESQFPAGP